MTEKVLFICPQCGGRLEVERGRQNCFCTYCGAKVEIGNNASYTYRKVDEARIREADVEEQIRIKELELESKRETSRYRLIKIWVIMLIVIAVLAVIILLFDRDNPNSIGYLLILVDFIIGALGALLIMETKKNNKDN